MSYNDLRDFEAEYAGEIDDLMSEGSVRVEVEKLGGGTLGKSYAGRWRYRVTLPDGTVHKGQDLETGTPVTHEQAARTAAEYFVS